MTSTGNGPGQRLLNFAHSIGINIQSCTFLHHITSLYVRDWIGCRLGREPEYWANSLGTSKQESL